MNTTLPELLTADELAGILRISRRTVRRWHRTGRLPALKIGRDYRFRKDDVAALISQGNESGFDSKEHQTPLAIAVEAAR